MKAELSCIGDEIANLRPSTMNGRPSSSGTTPKSVTSAPNSSNSTTVLLSRMRTLESKVSALASNLGSRTTSLEKDVETSLLVSERRGRKLDELYREASAENEALYERFNRELSRVAKEVQLGAGEEAFKSQLKEALEEVSRVKKDNLRLKREIVGLKAQQTASAIRGRGSKGEE